MKISPDKSIKLLLLDLLGAITSLFMLLMGFIYFYTSTAYFMVAIKLDNLYWSEDVLWWQPWLALFFGVIFLIGGFLMPKIIIRFTEDIHKFGV